MRWRRERAQRTPEGDPPALDDRTWSTRPSAPGGRVTEAMVRSSALPAETGPTWAPDRLSVWPVEGGRYGLDAHYHGRTGAQRAEHQRARLETVNLAARVSPGAPGETILRIGPLQHAAAWLALESFLGRPVEDLDPEAGGERL